MACVIEHPTHGNDTMTQSLMRRDMHRRRKNQSGEKDGENRKGCTETYEMRRELSNLPGRYFSILSILVALVDRCDAEGSFSAYMDGAHSDHGAALNQKRREKAERGEREERRKQ